jgi:DNA-binding NarL/FixJ family response regulator
MSEIKVGVAEDQQIFRKGLVLLLNSFENISVIHEADDGSVLLDQMAEECPDVVILDYSMPIMGGIETSKEIRKRFNGVKVLILSMYDDEEFVEAAIENGANGYLSKDDDLSEIENAIKGILTNNYYLNDRVSKIFINSLMKQGKINPKFVSNAIDFNSDELRILHLISKENTTQQIADNMNKSIRTIEKYRTRMMEKVGAQNSVGLIMYAVKHKIIEL